MVRTLALAVVIAAGSTASAYPKHWPIPNLYQPPTPSGHPEVMFTFDDGPHEDFTPRIVDTLARHGVQAMFFWNGYRVGYRSKTKAARVRAARQTVAAGHLIGNHTVDHVRPCRVSRAEAIREIDHNREILESVTGQPVILFRAPYGDRCPMLEQLLEERSLHHQHWDIDSQEWETADSEVVAEEVIDRLRTLHGRAIILLHDTHPSSARALSIILHWIALENADRRRDPTGRKTIKILQASEYVAEKWDVSLYDWAVHQLAETRRAAVRRAVSLIPGAAQSRLGHKVARGL